MTTKSQRAEHLVLLRDIIVLATTRNVGSRAELKRLATEERILARQDGRPFNYTSVYRYFDALRFLKLDNSAEGNDDLQLTGIALQIAEAGKSYYRQTFLSDREKAAFRLAIFASEARTAFLACFNKDNVSPRSQTEFISQSCPLYVVNESVRRPRGQEQGNDWPAIDNVELSFDPRSGKSMRKPRKEFLYAFRYWCLDAGIIDELNVREAERYGVRKGYEYVIYAINPDLAIAPSEFLDMILEILGPEINRPIVIPVPRLMYTVCPRRRLGVDAFRALLVETWHQYPGQLHLERGPGGLISGIGPFNEVDYGRRFGNHRYYPVVDGTIRSNLVIFPSNA